MSEVRAFFAIDVSSKEVLEKLAYVRDLMVSTTRADLKPVSNENLHITLRFIGEVPLKVVNELCRELMNIKFNAFKVHVKGLGAFPSTFRPRVVWAGVSEGVRELVELHDVIESIVRKHGIPREREKFIPHITLARVKSDIGIDKLIKFLGENYNYDFGEFTVNYVVLKKSILTPSGPIYSDLCSVKAVE